MLEDKSAKVTETKVVMNFETYALIFGDFEVQCNNLEKNAWQQSLGSISGIFN